MSYFYVSAVYTLVNLVLSLIIIVRSRRNVLSQFYAFCVFCLASLGTAGYLLGHPVDGIPSKVLLQAAAFLYSVFPFFFLHFMLIFVRRYEILRSPRIIVATYFAGIFSYALVLLGLVPQPFSAKAGITPTGYVYYLTWMSILFSIGVALLYSLIGGFSERGLKSNLLFVAFALLMLLLPTPFTLSIFSTMSEDSYVLYFSSSMCALAIVVFIVFRHRITMNTPYQTMKSALAAMNDILIKTNEHFKIEMVQGGLLQLLEYREHELVGRNLTEIVQHHERLEDYRRNALEEKTREGFFDIEVIRKNGTAIPMEFCFTPVFGNEEITGFVGVGRNVLERRRAEMLQDAVYRIAQSADKAASLDELFTSVHKIIGTVMPARNFYIALYDEKEDTISFSYFVDEVDAVTPPGKPGKGLTEYVLRTGKSLLCDTAQMEDLMNRGEAELVGAPSPIWLGVPLVVDRKTIGVMTVQHYSDPHAYGEREQQMLEYVSSQVARSVERKRVEEALRASEERYRLFFEEDLAGDLHSTPDGTILACNPSFVRIFGFASPEEAKKYNAKLLYPHATAYESLLKELVLHKKLAYHETELRRKDGTPVYVVENVIGTFNDRGELVKIKSYILDNTDRRKLEDQLRQAQKMENLGTMAGGIAHDFNNILAIILAHASALRRFRVKSDKFLPGVDAITRAVDRGAALVRQLLTFARSTDVLFESINVNWTVEELRKMLSATFSKANTFRLQLGKDIPTISADANQLHQALVNLCVNARDAMPNGGTITLSTETVSGISMRERFHEATEDHYVCISVADTGTGMDEATRARIFEPFFTTKEKGKGTGLGLSVVYGVMKSHHGLIDVESTVGTGTTFRLYFPAQPAGLEPVRVTPQCEEEPLGGDETILLVEDEELLLNALKELFEENGYHVLTAQDGLEAIEVYRQAHEEIDIMLTDIGLPKLSGWDAYLKIRTMNPGLKAIFASGHIDQNARAAMVKTGVNQFIQKPYVPREILKKVREVAESKAA